jgi:hypothetical protein
MRKAVNGISMRLLSRILLTTPITKSFFFSPKSSLLPEIFLSLEKRVRSMPGSATWTAVKEKPYLLIAFSFAA